MKGVPGVMTLPADMDHIIHGCSHPKWRDDAYESELEDITVKGCQRRNDDAIPGLSQHLPSDLQNR